MLDCNYPEQNQGWFLRLPYIKSHDVIYDNEKEARNVHITNGRQLCFCYCVSERT